MGATHGHSVASARCDVCMHSNIDLIQGERIEAMIGVDRRENIAMNREESMVCVNVAWCARAVSRGLHRACNSALQPGWISMYGAVGVLTGLRRIARCRRSLITRVNSVNC